MTNILYAMASATISIYLLEAGDKYVYVDLIDWSYTFHAILQHHWGGIATSVDPNTICTSSYVSSSITFLSA